MGELGQNPKNYKCVGSSGRFLRSSSFQLSPQIKAHLPARAVPWLLGSRVGHTGALGAGTAAWPAAPIHPILSQEGPLPPTSRGSLYPSTRALGGPPRLW